MWSAFVGPSSESSEGHGNSSIQRGKIFSAIFYGISSVLVIFTNKWLLTEFHFPYFKFVATVQFFTTSLILFILALMKKVDIPWPSYSIIREILPISLMFLGNVLCGLGSSNALNIPMFTALRRFSILMTMCGEWFLLGDKPATTVLVSVGLMVGGAMLAAMYDLAFDAAGYTMVFFNNIFTAMNGVWMKKASLSGKCGKMGVLFYNSLFSALIMSAYFIAEHNYYLRLSITTPSSGAPRVLSSLQRAQTMHSNINSYSELHPLHGAQENDLLPPAARKFIEQFNAPAERWSNRLLSTSGAVSSLRGTGRDANTVDLDRPGSQIHQDNDRDHSLLSQAEVDKAKARLNALNDHIHSEIQRYESLQQQREGTNAASADTTATAAALNLQQVQQPAPIAPERAKKAEQKNVSTITQVMAFQDWGNWRFIGMLLCACCMGSVLNYAIFLCTTRNSALTTAVVGTLKNVLTTYIGMVIFSDYTFTWVNFIGINISIVGSLYYTYYAMKS